MTKLIKIHLLKIIHLLLFLQFISCGNEIKNQNLENQNEETSNLMAVEIDDNNASSVKESLQSFEVLVGDMILLKNGLKELNQNSGKEIDSEEVKKIKTSNHSTKNNVEEAAVNGLSVYNGQLWTDGIIPIVFSRGINKKKQNAIFKACRVWGKKSKIRCVRKTNQEIFLTVTKKNNGCYANVGMVSNAKMNLGSVCWDNRTILHELGHVMGLMHEHQRADRGKYIKINAGNIKKESKSYFKRLNSKHHYYKYDFKSIMHYSNLAFSKNKKMTIVGKGKYSSYTFKIGRYKNLSSTDHKTARKMYGN